MPDTFWHGITIGCLALTACGCAYALAATALVRRFTRDGAPTATAFPGISILKPPLELDVSGYRSGGCVHQRRQGMECRNEEEGHQRERDWVAPEQVHSQILCMPAGTR